MKKFDQINVIPLIDVMLVLLAVVMVTASFISYDRLKLALPQTQQANSATPEPNALDLALDAKGTLFINDKPATLTMLSAQLHNESRPIVLRVDRHCAFEHFISVIERIKSVTPPPQLTILTEHVQP